MSDELPAGQVEANGRRYMTDARGALVPLELVKGQDRDQDAAVRKLFAAADEVSTILGTFKAEAFEQVDELQDRLDAQYKARIGGVKGNITLISFDGLLKIQVQVADRKMFGPELQTAKTLIDECLAEWSADSMAELPCWASCGWTLRTSAGCAPCRRSAMRRR